MEQRESQKKKLTLREKWTVGGVTGLFAAIGAIFGVIAYQHQWLG